MTSSVTFLLQLSTETGEWRILPDGDELASGRLSCVCDFDTVLTVFWVFHYINQQGSSHEEPRWEFLSAEQLQVMQSWHVPEYPGTTRRVWRCNKCDEDPATKVAVIKHMQM
jgi:hypothetical protein